MDSVEGAEGILFQVHPAVAAHAVQAHHRPASSARAAVQEHRFLLLRLPLCMCACSQCAETLSEEVLGKMHAPPKNDAVPVIDTHKLPEADGTFCSCYSYTCAHAQSKSVHYFSVCAGFLFGFPTRCATCFPPNVLAKHMVMAV